MANYKCFNKIFSNIDDIFGQIENQSFQDNPIFKTEQGKYLADNLASPLIKGLTHIANERPKDPIQYLTNYLQNYLNVRARNDETFTTRSRSIDNSAQVVAYNTVDNESLNEIMRDVKIFENNSDNNGNNSNNNNNNNNNNNSNNNNYKNNDRNDNDNDNDNDDDEVAAIKRMEERDEHGQSMLHFACTRSNRKGALINLIEESNIDITYRDELYRTARDVSFQANQFSNAKEIDRYVLSLAALGDVKPFEHLSISGYDHIIDIHDDNELSIIEVAEQRGHMDLVQFLQNLRVKEELREELHQMIRDNNLQRVNEIINSSNGKWLIKAKNYYGRIALHIAILKECEELVEKFVAICPEAIRIGDNLERSPLHYAMGTDNIENLSRILIQNGAKRTVKDLKGRQPSYYFMNKADILRLQEEENEIR